MISHPDNFFVPLKPQFWIEKVRYKSTNFNFDNRRATRFLFNCRSAINRSEILEAAASVFFLNINKYSI